MFDYGVSVKGHNTYKIQGQALTLASLSSPHKYNPRKGCEKILFISEPQVDITISKSKSLFALLLVEPNTSKEVPLAEFRNETFHSVMPLDDQCLPFEYKPTLCCDMNCDEYIVVFR